VNLYVALKVTMSCCYYFAEMQNRKHLLHPGFDMTHSIYTFY